MVPNKHLPNLDRRSSGAWLFPLNCASALGGIWVFETMGTNDSCGMHMAKCQAARPFDGPLAGLLCVPQDSAQVCDQ
jgi:hypothetical protein